MSRFMTGSGKFVPVVSDYNSTLDAPAQEATDYKLKTPPEKEEPLDVIPPTPENPDARPKFIQYAEEYFGRYWIVTLVLLIIVLFRKK